MPTFFYTAVSQKGERITGTEEAKSEHELAQSLRQKGFVITSSHVQGTAQRASFLEALRSTFFGVSLVEKLTFVRNLQVMVSAGVPIPKALEVLAVQSRSKAFDKAILSVKEAVLKGSSLSEAMVSHSTIFSELFVNMVKVGEESGTLEQVLSYLSLQLEREHDLKSKVQGALLYPAVILVALVGIGILMLVVVVPSLASTFKDLGVELPPTTRAIIELGLFLSRAWFLIPIALLGLMVTGLFVFRLAKVKLFFDTVLLHAPLLAGFIKKSQTATTARTLSSLISSGVPIVRSLEITSKVLGNAHFQRALSYSAEEMRKGAKLSAVLQKHQDLFPAMVFQMLEVGEETGKTGEMLQKVAEFFEEELTNLTKNLSSIIEPILMLAMGIIVGFFALSMIQPMYSMLNAIQ